MAASEIEQWWIDKFQENLGPIRKVAGWTTQQLADELGVARQTVSNLETGKSPMTKLQYLALRTVFSAEIARREDRDLARIIKTLVDDPIEQRIRERRAQEQDGEAVADNAPVNTDGGNVADNAATEKRKPSTATLKASKTAATGKPTLSTAMQALAVITGALASGTAAGIITYLCSRTAARTSAESPKYRNGLNNPVRSPEHHFVRVAPAFPSLSAVSSCMNAPFIGREFRAFLHQILLGRECRYQPIPSISSSPRLVLPQTWMPCERREQRLPAPAQAPALEPGRPS